MSSMLKSSDQRLATKLDKMTDDQRADYIANYKRKKQRELLVMNNYKAFTEAESFVVDHNAITPDEVLSLSDRTFWGSTVFEYVGAKRSGIERIKEILLPGPWCMSSAEHVKYFNDLGYDMNPPAVAVAHMRTHPQYDGGRSIVYLGDDGGSWQSDSGSLGLFTHVAILHQSHQKDSKERWVIGIENWLTHWLVGHRFSVRERSTRYAS